jgi:hypothetical protein
VPSFVGYEISIHALGSKTLSEVNKHFGDLRVDEREIIKKSVLEKVIEV